MNITVGFDGTCVTDDFPKMGKEIGAAEALRLLRKRGHRITLSTKRVGHLLDEAMRWFKTNGILIELGLEEDLRIDAYGLGVPLIHGDHAYPYVDWNRVMQMIDFVDDAQP